MKIILQATVKTANFDANTEWQISITRDDGQMPTRQECEAVCTAAGATLVRYDPEGDGEGVTSAKIGPQIARIKQVAGYVKGVKLHGTKYYLEFMGR
jgi:hypothetical protein